MSSNLISPVAETILDLQKARKIRIDKFHYSVNSEGWTIEMAFYVYETREDVSRVFKGKLIDSVREQAMQLLNQVP